VHARGIGWDLEGVRAREWPEPDKRGCPAGGRIPAIRPGPGRVSSGIRTRGTRDRAVGAGTRVAKGGRTPDGSGRHLNQE